MKLILWVDLTCQEDLYLEKRALRKDSLILDGAMAPEMEGLGEIGKDLIEDDIVKSVIRLS